ncbi:MAG: agmatinase [Methanobrevibacter sp.]|uniref:agmatinase n=1 Tax=Methanobrevibacter sp. TaxID=66852 RepID=UPI0026E0E1B4|nr:agmatinase [Methanobrevibacter sp.]MDO5848274.1 agmatinase [Methanobrevibacter sp.]
MLFNTYDPWKFAFSKSSESIDDVEEEAWGIIGVPFDSTTSYHSGARLGPIVVREASYGFEMFNIDFNTNLDTDFYDFGDSNVIPGNCVATVDLVKSNVAELMSHKIKPILIGGEHSVSIGAVEALKNRYSNLTVVHLDAHRDLADTFMGERYSHATVMRRIHDLKVEELIQIGIRSSSSEEEAFANESPNIKTFRSNEVKNHIDNILYYLSQIETPIYLSIDMDVLDPIFAPSVGNPTPLGITIQDIQDIMECLAAKNIVGMDVVETATDRLGDITAVAASKLVYDFLTLM